MTSNQSNDHVMTTMMLMMLQSVQEWRANGEHQRVLDLAQPVLDSGEGKESFAENDPMNAALASLAANAGASALALGRPRVALDYAEKEITFAKRDGGDYSLSRAFNNRGLAQHELGDLALAESDYLSALAIIERASDESVKSLRSSVANNLGQLRITRGEDAGMQNLVESALLPPPMNSIAGATTDLMQLNNRGFTAMYAGDFAGAEAAWKEAATTASANKESAATRGIIASNLAELYHRTNRNPQAVECYEEAIRIHASDPGSKVALATDYNNLGILYQQAGNRAKAIENFKHSWECIREVAPRSLVALSALKGIALQRIVEQDFKRARAALKRGIGLYEEMRPAIAVTEPGHAGYLAAYRQLLEFAMYLSLNDSWPDELLDFIEQAKARFSLERIVARNESPTVKEESRRNDDHRNLTGFNALVLNYFVGPNATFLSYGYNRSLGGARIDVGEAELSKLVQSFRDDLMSSSRRAGQGEIALRLSRLLFEKVHIQGEGVRYIHVMPDGPLWYLPFEALPRPEWLPAQNDETRLGAVSPLSYVPSMRVLGALHDRNKELTDRSDWRFLVVGEPKTGDGFAPLDGTAIELEYLRKLASDRVEVISLQGADATKKLFLSHLPTATHIHIASHAVADLDGEDPYVLFSGPGEDKYLRTRELQHARMNAQLVFLSACSTSIGKSSTGEGLMSMARAFLWAGCRCVVATLWPVYDAAAPEFVRLFYAGLLAGLSVAQAASAARNQFRGPNDGPRTWAAFQVFGDGDIWADRYSLEHIDYLKESA
jgi:CHAT domain-containing protein